MRADSPCQNLSLSFLMPRKCFCQPARQRTRYSGADEDVDVVMDVDLVRLNYTAAVSQ